MNKKTQELYQTLNASQKKLVKRKIEEQLKKGKVGSGFFDKLVKGVKKVSANLPNIRKTVVDIGNKVVKKTEARNPKWEYDPPANEKLHQIFKTPSGLYNAKWSGPGDRVVPKINKLWDKHNGDVSAIVDASNWASKADLYAFLHDLLYTLSSDEDDKTKRNKLIRDADNHLIKRLTQYKNSGGGSNASIPLKLIQLKIKAEDAGAAVYAGDEKIPDQQSRDRINTIKEHLLMVGAGNGRPRRVSVPVPKKGGAKKKPNPWLTHLGKFWKENKGKMTYKEAMAEAKKTY